MRGGAIPKRKYRLFLQTYAPTSTGKNKFKKPLHNPWSLIIIISSHLSND